MASAQMRLVPSPLSFPLQQHRAFPTFIRRKLSLKSSSSVGNLTSSTNRARKVRYVLQRPLTILMNLPTANPEWTTNGKSPKWSQSAIKSFCIAETVPRKLRWSSFGTEALLMGILMEGTSPTARFLWANGITFSKVKEESIKLIGLPKRWESHFLTQVPLSEHAQKALDSAVEEKIKLGESDEVTTSHMLLGIWAQKGSTGQKVLATLGFDDEKAKEVSQMKEVAMSK